MDRSSYQVRINQWVSIIREQASSHMTKSAWCRENGINLRQFFYWQRKLRNVMLESSNNTPSDLIPSKQNVPAFCELSVPALKQPGTIVPRDETSINGSDLIIEINNCRILIGNSVSKKTLSYVIEVLRHV